MFNVAVTLIGIAFGTGLEALKVRMQKGVYFRETRVAMRVILLLSIAVLFLFLRDETMIQWIIGGLVLFLVAEMFIPYERATIQIRNGSHTEAHRELVRLLDESGFTYETSSSGFDNTIYRFSDLGRSKLIVKDKGSFIEEEYSDRAELVAVYTGYGNPLKEVVDTYIYRMRDLRETRSFSRTTMILSSVSVILSIIAALLFFQAWQSPAEFPNQRIDELFD
ncbi:hypothetical protein [Salisediminibacterium beveridgei]|uniref:Uncharacterized protein n=1 Tax=Salisediminibacterium beveridgei TaxID=632773 RepID=A0A1D7QZ06_9BACI|nr:hypothetical protein [Salisediminibacterium beveridgei]AOM84228.1 hypothetical protein BBEV_2903 [Salisediminibacterium beveridgei]